MDNCLTMAFALSSITKKLDKEIALLSEEVMPNLFIVGNAADYPTWSTFFSNQLLVTSVIQQGIPYSFFELILNRVWQRKLLKWRK
jgi:hypothetical protein